GGGTAAGARQRRKPKYLDRHLQRAAATADRCYCAAAGESALENEPAQFCLRGRQGNRHDVDLTFPWIGRGFVFHSAPIVRSTSGVVGVRSGPALRSDVAILALRFAPDAAPAFVYQHGRSPGSSRGGT